MIIPKKCPFCGGEVIFTSNKFIYGKEYGNGKCYVCVKCKAFVGVHKNSKDKPLGILANKEMRMLRKYCHKLFDPIWMKQDIKRSVLYSKLAYKLNIQLKECHFGHFDIKMLKKAINILSDKNWYK